MECSLSHSLVTQGAIGRAHGCGSLLFCHLLVPPFHIFHQSRKAQCLRCFFPFQNIWHAQIGAHFGSGGLWDDDKGISEGGKEHTYGQSKIARHLLWERVGDCFGAQRFVGRFLYSSVPVPPCIVRVKLLAAFCGHMCQIVMKLLHLTLHVPSSSKCFSHRGKSPFLLDLWLSESSVRAQDDAVSGGERT